MSHTALAEAISESAGEAGCDVAALNAAAWAAGVCPEATHGLVGAALALGASVPALSAASPPVADDRTLLSAAEDMTAACAEMLAAAQGQRAQAVANYEAACDEIALLLASADDDDPAELPMLGIAAAQRRIADCETAIEGLDETIARVTYAIGCLERVPDDMEAAYEAPLAYIRSGHVLPYSGDWLTAPERHAS